MRPNTLNSTETQNPGRDKISIPTTSLWRPTLTSNRSSEDHTASAIREVTVIAVIDESYKANWVTSVLIIEGSEYAKQKLPQPAPPQDTPKTKIHTEVN